MSEAIEPVKKYSDIDRFAQSTNAPDVCWKPSQLVSHLQLSQQLILRLDQEKGITENSLVTQPEAPAEADQSFRSPSMTFNRRLYLSHSILPSNESSHLAPVPNQAKIAPSMR